MIVNRFGCTAIHNKALYKCITHSNYLVAICERIETGSLKRISLFMNQHTASVLRLGARDVL